MRVSFSELEFPKRQECVGQSELTVRFTEFEDAYVRVFQITKEISHAHRAEFERDKVLN